MRGNINLNYYSREYYSNGQYSVKWNVEKKIYYITSS